MHELLVIMLSSVPIFFLPGQAAGSSWRPLQVVQADVGKGSSSTTKRAQPRRRRSRRKSRGGAYKIVEVKDGGTIEGVVFYQGQVPAQRKIQIVKDQETCRHRSTKMTKEPVEPLTATVGSRRLNRYHGRSVVLARAIWEMSAKTGLRRRKEQRS